MKTIVLFSVAVTYSLAGLFEDVSICFHRRTESRTSEREKISVRDYIKGYPFIITDFVVDDDDISAILFLTECIKDVSNDHFEDRKFERGAYDYGGGMDAPLA